MTLQPAAWRGAAWAALALVVTRRRLRRSGLEGTVVPAPPVLPASAARGVDAVLRRTNPTCLERSLVRQRWLAAHGTRVDVVVGVTAPSEGFAAHAWLDGEADPLTQRFHELKRIAAP